MSRERSDIAAALLTKGFQPKSGDRDHEYFFLVAQGLKQSVFTKLSRGSGYRTYGDNLMALMARQLRLTRRQLNDLVDCPMSEEDYRAHLRSISVLPDVPPP